ncbi:MAG TPA: double-strand break repair helicase AddA [Xanthobacteraceae bacterium]|jgi:ATP-dependent helicase/nuclease subunit A
MTALRAIPEELLRIQAEASDPAVSAWVTANAGSGKTHVLAQRVIRLLLDGVDPTKILCITFTKAAAANMANRVFDELRRWTTLDDAELDAAIGRISDIRPDAVQRALARRLFALALETPGGLKVQTIHAFCTRLLHQFPFEANVAARFDVLDEAAEALLLGEISLGVLLEAAMEPDGALGRALATAMVVAADQTFKDVVAEALRKRAAVRAWIDHGGSIAAAIAGLCGALGVGVDDSIDAIDREITDGPLLPTLQWAAAAATLARGSKSDREQAQRLGAALGAAGSERADIYLQLFLTGKFEPRDRVATKAIETRDPELADRLCRERSRVLALVERRKAVACRDRTAALVTIAEAVISRYRATKDRRGLLDYDDLIDKTLDLLGEEQAAWVHYKLDRGIDHVLIDEAQDTSPKQWEIIRRLTAEFFAGAGARDVRRTVFAVGDEKQSIFSFQGAAPREFEVMHRTFDALSKAVAHDFRYVRFRHSFRSGPNVLGAVDDVFARPEAFAGLSADTVKTVHESLPDAAPGVVEIWDTIKPNDKREIEAWDAPFDELTETSPQLRLATRIAKNVKRWTEQGARAGDVLVLVRQRGPLFEAIIRALKDLHVPVAGADRLVLTEHIAVMDLMALADALLLPDDDLALATVLKSPLFGFDDADLFEIAWGRKGSLRAALRSKAPGEPRFADAVEKLDRFAAWARQTPFAFYACVLGAERGRKRFLARLGHEAEDALDEFLNLALEYERRKTPSLQGFVAWLRTARTDVKRDMEITRDEVRVMTVHGAKGLEAPIVVLADTTTEPAGPPQRQPRLVALADDTPHSPRCLAWLAAQPSDSAPLAAARDRMRQEAADEYRRLLYVAMTRAIDRLVVCGAEGQRRRPEGCWWDLVFAALQPPVSVEEPADDGEGKVWRYRKVLDAARKTGPEFAAPPAHGRPAWLDRDVPAEQPPLRPLSPSDAYDEATPARARAGGRRAERDKALARGVLMHRLLQTLPDIPNAARAAAARRHLARAGSAFSADERETMFEQIRMLLDDPRFAQLFLPGSRAEVPIVGRLDGGRLAVSGQVDRLALTSDSLLIADYKTNRPAPRRVEDVPQAYVTQLALYRAVLGQLFPHRPIRAALIWTDIPDLMEISAASLDAALAGVTSP